MAGNAHGKLEANLRTTEPSPARLLQDSQAAISWMYALAWHPSRMARRTVVVVTDDLDGSTKAEALTFSFEGVDYTIDLAKKNRTAFEKAIRPYIEAATELPQKPAKRRATGTKGRDLAAVRAWANANGLAVSARGRVPEAVLAQYDAAQ